VLGAQRGAPAGRGNGGVAADAGQHSARDGVQAIVRVLGRGDAEGGAGAGLVSLGAAQVHHQAFGW
jgi:hypothetical protein